jgi:hypothetical protein
VFFTVGTVARFSTAVAAALVEDGRAEYATNEMPRQPEPTVTVSPAAVPAVSLGGLTVAELKKKAKAAGVDGYARMKKAQLIAALGG